jgi:Ca2+-binding RTX toxin-like protein
VGAARVKAQNDECAIGPPGCVGDLTIEAPPGERNELTIRADGAGIVVTDAATPLQPDRNCALRDDGSVRCELDEPITQVTADTNDGDDVVSAVVPAAQLVFGNLGAGDDRFEGHAREVWGTGSEGDDVLVALGGAGSLEGREGDDVLVGGPAADTVLDGGPGSDRVSGGPGNDVLHGDDSADIVDPETFAPDALDGGPGRDRVTYEGRGVQGVVVDLATGAAGTGGEGDTLRGIEDARGSQVADVLAGDAGPNRLDGQGGPDTLDGREGDDLVRPGGGSSFLPATAPERARGGPGDDDVSAAGRGLASGGPGDDVLRPGRAGRAYCGPGDDVVAGTRTIPAIGAACEAWTLRLGATLEARFPYPRRLGGAVRLNVPCPGSAPCTVELRVSTPQGAPLGRARARLAPGTRRTVTARVQRRGRARVVLTVDQLRPWIGGVEVLLR